MSELKRPTETSTFAEWVAWAEKQREAIERTRFVIISTLQDMADEAFDPEDAEDSDGVDQATRNAYLDAMGFVDSEFASLLKDEDD